jgi:hypothetical protein
MVLPPGEFPVDVENAGAVEINVKGLELRVSLRQILYQMWTT